jgi:hypothetical protein
MACNSRQKGAAGEREACREIERVLGVKMRRGQQFCGANGDADVVGIPGVHIEVKRVQNLNLTAAMAQSVSDAKNGEIPIVVHRKDRSEWLATVRLSDLKALSELIARLEST